MKHLNLIICGKDVSSTLLEFVSIQKTNSLKFEPSDVAILLRTMMSIDVIIICIQRL